MALIVLVAGGPLVAQSDRGIETAVAGSGRQPDRPASAVLFPRTGYAWPWSSGPGYPEVAAPRRRAAGVLHTAVGVLDRSALASGELPLADELRGERTIAAHETRYFIVQFEPGAVARGALVRLKATLAIHGGAIVAPMPVAAVVARLSAASRAALDGLPGLLGVEPYHPALKLHPSIGRLPLPDPLRAASSLYELNVRLFDGEDSRAMAERLAELGGRVTHTWPDSVRVEIDRSRLAEVAALEGVRVVFEQRPPHPLGEETTTVLQTGSYRGGATPFHDAGVTGAGPGGPGSCTISAGACTENRECNGVEDVCTAAPQVLLVIDTGVQLDAGDLSDARANAGTAGPGHRKVRRYETVNGFGGSGDLAGCDDLISGGVTHGHVVAATAVGNATNVETATYGEGWLAFDRNGNPWRLDGVAPGALLVVFDAQRNTRSVGCDDPQAGTLDPGDLYSGGTSGSLGDSYFNDGSRVVSLSWGTSANVYDPDATDIDQFQLDRKDALVVLSAGNGGVDANRDGIPDSGSLSSPATSKNGLAIGASRAVGIGDSPESRAFFSATGPAPGGRIAPQLMAPGDEGFNTNLGLPSEFVCRSSDNGQGDPVECDLVQGQEGTSYAAAGAAGSALLVRDYFAQGFHSDATASNPGNAADRVPNVSGALVKALLIASADFMTGANLSLGYRANDEQGFGRIQLDNALPLQGWPDTPSALLVSDGGIAGGVSDLTGLTGVVDAQAGATESAVFTVCDPSQELRIALVWTDEVDAGLTGALVNDLDLELESPGGRIYRGNYFTDDDDRDGTIDPSNEDCPSLTGASGLLDAAAWSLPACTRGDATASPHDRANPSEAIMLSPDYHGDAGADPDPADDNQIEVGGWTLRVRAQAGGNEPAQRYAVAVAGGLCQRSAIRLDAARYACNEELTITVSEGEEAGDPLAGLDPLEIAARTTLEVLEAGAVVDCEGPACASPGPGPPFEQPDPVTASYRAAGIALSAGTARDPGNGILDVRHGDVIRAVYADESGGASDPDKRRTSSASVDCRVDLEFGAIAFAQFGADAAFRVNGGCERNARGLFEFGFPDRYLDAGETLIYDFAFGSNEDIDLEQVEVSLRCVTTDADSPADCLPPKGACADPERLNNPACPGYMTITNSPLVLDLIPARSAISGNFVIDMAATIAGTPEIELVLEVEAATAGRSGRAIAINRHTLDVDELSEFYSTDFPTGGMELVDWNNNERIENPTTDLGDSVLDYRFETRVWSDLTAGGTRNASLTGPWNFDVDDNGFRVGLGAVTDEQTITDVIAQWGEDKDFDGLYDGECALGLCTDGIRPCTADAQCLAGDSCVFTRQGFCSVSTTTQCEIDADCPAGEACEIAECAIRPECIAMGITGAVQCLSSEDRDPQNFKLDSAWSTLGGCGWQTRAPGSCSNDGLRGCYDDADCLAGGQCTGSGQSGGGIWHTGNVLGPIPASCDFNETPECQSFETVSGDQGVKTWFELLVTPEIEKVNGPGYQVEILDWAWNQTVDLPDSNVLWTWEFDTDTARAEPANLFSDLGITNFGAGRWGPVSNGGSPVLTNGFTLFSPVDIDGSVNGSVGNDREGHNACLFVTANMTASAVANLGFAAPPDDDLNNGNCPFDPAVSCTAICVGGSDDGQRCNDVAGDGDCAAGDCSAVSPDCAADSCAATVCALSGAACTTDADCQACQFDDALVDEYVQANGPLRNMGLFAFKGPDMRFVNLADVYGVPAGDTFQAALGMLNFEKISAGAPDPERGYGVGVDDMVIQWREFTLVSDAVDCATGRCASIELAAATIASARTSLTITVIDLSPSVNDCNDDGDRSDSGIDDTDCDDDGTADVRIEASSDGGEDVERVTLNATGHPGEYRGTLPLSSATDAPGVLFVQPIVTPSFLGTQVKPPTVTVAYDDLDDGTGQPCANSIDPLERGRVSASAGVLMRIGNVAIVATVLSDNGDDDGWADTDETVEMKIRVLNKTGADLTGVSASLSSSDPVVECIQKTTLFFGDLSAGQTALSAEGFRFKLADVDRTVLGLDEFDDLAATFEVHLFGDQFDAVAPAQQVRLQLDLDAVGGAGPGAWTEGFESGDFGTFSAMNLDAGRNDLVGSDGYRCQYTDPDWPNSNSYGLVTDCFLAASAAQADAFYWQVDGPASFDGGRAYSGTHSLYMGVPLDATLGYTTTFATLEAIATTDPLNLGWERVCSESRTVPCSLDADCPAGESCEGATSELAFKHQLRLYWESPTTSGDRAVVQAQLADDAGAPIGDWANLVPYYNVYDRTGEDNFTNCQFDPVDDGTTEDDFFDPLDPDRRLGPSSTCFPAPVFVQQGDTFFPFNPQNTTAASDGPGLEGSAGIGTWVESRFNLDEYRGRRIRLRFLRTALKVGSVETWQAIFAHNPDPDDDGWWIDDVEVSDTLSVPGQVSVDTKDNSGLPGCGAICTSAEADLVADPSGPLAVPGRVVELSAAGSTVDSCRGGPVQYRFWIDGNGDGAGGDAADTLLRDWTDNPRLPQAPNVSTPYLAEVRCATDPACAGSAGVLVVVNCPTTGPAGVFPSIAAPDRATLAWGVAEDATFARGSLAAVGDRAAIDTGTLAAATGLDISVDDGSSWYLFRRASSGSCNSGGSWRSGGADERPGRDASLP